MMPPITVVFGGPCGIHTEMSMDVAAYRTEQQLQQLTDREPRADLAKRLRTVLLARQGFTAPEIAICTSFSSRTVQEWMARYNREGLAGLETKPGRRTAHRRGDQAAPAADRGRPLPEDGVCVLRGRDIQRILY